MTELEQLENEAYKDNVNIVIHPFKSEKIKGLYCDGIIALNTSLETAYGDILGNDIISIKQEAKGRIYAYNKLVGLSGLLSAYKANCKSLYEIAE